MPGDQTARSATPAASGSATTTARLPSSPADDTDAWVPSRDRIGPAPSTVMIVDATRSTAHTAASPPAITHSATVATSAGATPTACMPARSCSLPISWLVAQASAGRVTVLTSRTTEIRRQALAASARSASRSDRPVAKTSTASAESMPFAADTARPGPGAATPAAAATSTRTSRNRSDASATGRGQRGPRYAQPRLPRSCEHRRPRSAVKVRQR